MKTEIQETQLYNDFIKALDIHDMRADDNPFVVACCKITKEKARQISLPFIARGFEANGFPEADAVLLAEKAFEDEWRENK